MLEPFHAPRAGKDQLVPVDRRTGDNFIAWMAPKGGVGMQWKQWGYTKEVYILHEYTFA